MSQEIRLPKDAGRAKVLGALIGLLQALKPDWEWVVTIKRYRKDRTAEQNNALFGVAYKAITEATGHEDHDLHEFFCGEFFGWVERDVFGQRKRKPRRTTTRDEHGKRDVLPTDKFAELYDFIQRRMAVFGVYVPDPDPMWRMNERSAA